MKQEQHPYDEDWRQEAPRLSELQSPSKGQSGEVPEGYFSNFADRLRERLPALESAPVPPAEAETTVFRSAHTWRIVGMAAGLALLIAAGLYGWSRFVAVPVVDDPIYALESQLDQLTDDELVDAIAFNDIPDDVVAEVMGDEALAAFELEAFGQSIEDGDILESDLDWNDLEMSELDEELVGDLEEYFNAKHD